MIVATQLRKHVVRPTLKKMQMWSESAEQLIMGTAAHESRMGTYLHQIGGPALGIYQIEPATHHDIWENYLKYRPRTTTLIAGFSSRHNSDLRDEMTVDDQELITNLAYSTAICRMIYYRVPEALPEANDIKGLAEYWKKYYNTIQGRGTVEQFEKDFKARVN